MSSQVSESIYQALSAIRLIDPHTHINPHDPASHTLADLLGYHYYTELAHSAGMPKDRIEEAGIGPRELVSRLVEKLPTIENTAQYRWLVELCRTFYGFDADRIDASNWEDLYDAAESRMNTAEWPQMVLDHSNVEAVFLTNDFDDDLSGFDTDIYIPCLRTDELVFHLGRDTVRQRLSHASGIELDGSLASLREALTRRFEHFVSRGARACAISLPPSFSPAAVPDGRAATALDHVLRHGIEADPAHRDALSRRVFWTLAELCDQFGLPFDLMIGVNRAVYAEGVYQGQDLYDSRVSLIQYREMLNAFPNVKFPISVLASVTNQELVSYAWIFPNVITSGHWWYSNTPSFIARDCAARLEAVPQTKQIAYYSDAYKLEFVWPKFDMYRRTLADVLSENFVRRNGWSEERAIELGRQILRNNVDEIFPRPDTSKIRAEVPAEQNVAIVDEWSEQADAESLASLAGVAVAGFSGIAASALGAVNSADDMPEEEVSDDEQYVMELVSDNLAEPEPDDFDIVDPESDPYATTEFGAQSPLSDFDQEPTTASELTNDSLSTWISESDPQQSSGAPSGEEIPERIAARSVTGAEDDDSELDSNDSNELNDDASEMDLDGYATIVEPLDQNIEPVKTVSSSDSDEPNEADESDWDGDDDAESQADAFATVLQEPAEELDTEIMPQAFATADEDSDWQFDSPDDVPERAELDASPTDDEVESLGIEDVQLRNVSDIATALGLDHVEQEFDSEPLNVGDLLGESSSDESTNMATVHKAIEETWDANENPRDDQDDSGSGANQPDSPEHLTLDDDSDEPSPKIRMLTGDGSFSPDEESLQMISNPSTGELVLPVGNGMDDELADADLMSDSDDDVDEWEIDDEDTVVPDNPPEETAESQQTIGIDDITSTVVDDDDDDWFAQLSDMMDEEKPGDNVVEDDKH